jgi:hypothetical protein
MNAQTLQRKHIVFQMISRETLLISGVYNAFTEMVKSTIKKSGGQWNNNADYQGWMTSMDHYEKLHIQVESYVCMVS